MQIIPSILEYSEQDFESRLDSLSQLSNHLHIDIVDESVGKPTINTKQVIDILTSRSSNTNTFEFHLMVKDPSSAIDAINSCDITATKIYVHVGQLSSIQDGRNKKIGFYINPDDQIDEIVSGLQSTPSALIMTINPGRQGNPFMPDQLLKIKSLRKSGFLGEIYLDGGIGTTEARQIADIEYKPNGVVIGSFLHDSPDQNLLLLKGVFAQT